MALAAKLSVEMIVGGSRDTFAYAFLSESGEFLMLSPFPESSRLGVDHRHGRSSVLG